jgi:hypothetical protein
MVARVYNQIEAKPLQIHAAEAAGRTFDQTEKGWRHERVPDNEADNNCHKNPDQ